jgi:hypothetical protein
MRAIELIGDIDNKHRLSASVPEDLPAGPVRLIVLLSEEDEADGAWALGVAREWTHELGDPRQDLYTLADGSRCIADFKPYPFIERGKRSFQLVQPRLMP